MAAAKKLPVTTRAKLRAQSDLAQTESAISFGWHVQNESALDDIIQG